MVPVAGGKSVRLMGGVDGALLSPDGSLLSYICPGARRPGRSSVSTQDLCLANADGSDPRVIAEGHVRWTSCPIAGLLTDPGSPTGCPTYIPSYRVSSSTVPRWEVNMSVPTAAECACRMVRRDHRPEIARSTSGDRIRRREETVTPSRHRERP